MSHNDNIFSLFLSSIAKYIAAFNILVQTIRKKIREESIKNEIKKISKFFTMAIRYSHEGCAFGRGSRGGEEVEQVVKERGWSAFLA